MKEKFKVFIIIFGLLVSSIPATGVPESKTAQAASNTVTGVRIEFDSNQDISDFWTGLNKTFINDDYVDIDDDDYVDIDDNENFPEYHKLTILNVIKVTPAKRTISRKKSFKIKITLNKEFTEDMEQEEIDTILADNIDEITYRSTRNSVASVNKEGKVTAKKKGATIIKTTLIMKDGTEGTYKTVVKVKP